MKKIIEVKIKERLLGIYYKGKHIGDPVWSLIKYFNIIEEGRYKVIVTEGKEYDFYYEKDYYDEHYCIVRFSIYACAVCKDAFNKLFFIPEKGKRYNIEVQRV